MKELHTVGPDGQEYQFWFDIEASEDWQKPRYWILRVRRTNPPVASDDFYEAKFEALDDVGPVCTSYIGNHEKTWAKKKGISEAVFREASSYLKREIISSRQWVHGSAERQSDLARKMWMRFVDSGLAEFDPTEQRFRYLPVSIRASAVRNREHR